MCSRTHPQPKPHRPSPSPPWTDCSDTGGLDSGQQQRQSPWEPPSCRAREARWGPDPDRHGLGWPQSESSSPGFQILWDRNPGPCRVKARPGSLGPTGLFPPSHLSTGTESCPQQGSEACSWGGLRGSERELHVQSTAPSLSPPRPPPPRPVNRLHSKQCLVPGVPATTTPLRQRIESAPHEIQTSVPEPPPPLPHHTQGSIWN